uniref:Putative pancreatic lipase-related protein n=1 Tax=Pectinaria gouldii TaxID=260746 RepID=A0A0K1R054_PECGU|nr:putative pancreatic lipase-related protein [Pectinaria gouldii]
MNSLLEHRLENMLLKSFIGLGLLAGASAIFCPGLGDFPNNGAFEGWRDSTCPGNPGLELSYMLHDSTHRGGEEITWDGGIGLPSWFDPSNEVWFIAHGWNNHAGTPWLTDMMNNFIDADSSLSVVIVGWGGPLGSQDLNYGISAATTRTVGAQTGEVLIAMQAAGLSPNNAHLTGHSLGSHVVGHAGRWAAAQGFLPNRVVGMDPAGPSFSENDNRSVGIYVDCGQHVEIIHTDEVYGSTPTPEQPNRFLGDQDFFPNGGAEQPGCGIGENICSHGKAVDYMSDSIINSDANAYQAESECDFSNDIPGFVQHLLRL